MRQRRPFKSAAWCAGFYFFTNVLFVHAGEASLWEERRRHAQRPGADGVQVAGLPVDALSALPALSRVSRSADLPVSEGSPAAGGPAWQRSNLILSAPTIGSPLKVCPAGRTDWSPHRITAFRILKCSSSPRVHMTTWSDRSNHFVSTSGSDDASK